MMLTGMQQYVLGAFALVDAEGMDFVFGDVIMKVQWQMAMRWREWYNQTVKMTSTKGQKCISKTANIFPGIMLLTLTWRPWREMLWFQNAR